MPAALLFGLAVHWRLYPVIFALPLLRHFALARHRAAQRTSAAAATGPWRLLAALFDGLWSPSGLAFGAISGGLFLGLAALFYRLYGHPFLHETYLYHTGRTDPRHNFSPYFYPAYLATGGGGGDARWDVGW